MSNSLPRRSFARFDKLQQDIERSDHQEQDQHQDRLNASAREKSKKRIRFNWCWYVSAVRFVMLSFLSFLSVFLLIIYVYLAPGQPIYRLLLFHAVKYPIGIYKRSAVAGIQPVDAFFKSPDGKTLHGWFFKIQDAKQVVLLSHGNGGNITDRRALAFKLMQNHRSVFLYDYEGFGRSEGEPSMEALLENGEAAYKYLISNLHYTPDQIVLFGESLGTIVTAWLSTRQPSAGVILECPLYSLKRKAQEMLPYLKLYPEWSWPAGGLDISHDFTGTHAPLLIIAGTADSITPVTYADEIIALSTVPKNYVRIDDAGHGDPAMMRSREFDDGLRTFLRSL